MIVGKNTFVHPTAVIGDNVVLGDNVYIGPLCVIGYQPEWKGKEHNDAGVWVMDGARLTGLVTVDSGVYGKTVIGAYTYLMKHSHIGHDAVICKDAIISCGAKIGGHAVIGLNTNVGLNAVVHQKKEVPDNCMIGMGAVVTKGLKMEPGQKYVGNPAKWLSENIIK